jgi:hypothetical protein
MHTIGASNASQQLQDALSVGIRLHRLGPPAHQIPEVVIGTFQQSLESRLLAEGERGELPIEEPGQHQIELQHATPAMPAQAVGFAHARTRNAAAASRIDRQTARRTKRSLILPIARVGFSPFGQTSTQFMIEWQRNKR